MGLFSFLHKLVKPRKNKTYNAFNWELHCESCDKVLEDCECDWKNQCKQETSQDMDDLEFDEMNDIWDEE